MSHGSVSRPVHSSQRTAHPRLASTLERRGARAWRQPLHEPSVRAFEALAEGIDPDRDRLVLDSGCGSGESTRAIARAYPECRVIGVDKSAARLSRLGQGEFPRYAGNAIWLRAELATFWRLALKAGWRLERHYLLYPNPWPKPGQVQRRWHAHPVFPDLLALGGRLELRCNWRIYAEEFALAVERLAGIDARLRDDTDPGITTPFERKYRSSGHALYSVVASLGNGAV
ncbi:MAG: SAM-dependent methyltransferase [Xanthomonadales bacterium]|nr:SAM-dependent methyltransferase [Xanthomonadales bacterium]